VLTDLHHDHTISDDAFVELTSQVDQMLATSEIVWSDVKELNDSLWSIHSRNERSAPDTEA